MERSMSFDHNRFSSSLTSPVVVSCNGLEIMNKKLYNKIILHLQKKMAKKNPRFARPPLKKMNKKKKKKSTRSIKEITKGSPSDTAASTNDGGVRNLSSSWVKSHLLGRGAYASVYLATSKSHKDKTEKAIKTAELSRASSLMDEGRILIRLQSPFVVLCYGDEIAVEANDLHKQYNLILEYCSGQCIADLIEDNHGGLIESDVNNH